MSWESLVTLVAVVGNLHAINPLISEECTLYPDLQERIFFMAE